MKDSRTELPGHDDLYEDVRQLFAKAGTRANPLTLLCVALEGVDLVLRTFGPVDRDAVVREVGRRIRKTVPDGSTVYHVTQARFGVLLPVANYRKVTRTARRVVDVLSQPFDVRSIPDFLHPYVGISSVPHHAADMSELVRTAVLACQQARDKAHADYAIVDTEADARERERFHLMADLRLALNAEDQIHVAYQPVIELETGICRGAEALCRWKHPTRGFLPPSSFLRFIEQTTLILPLTEFVLATALGDLAEICDGLVAVNVSPGLLANEALVDRLEDKLRFFNVPGRRLCLEVTETGTVDEPVRAAETLHHLRGRNISIAVDNFGTGHSSLADLANHPADVVKIDRYFIQNLGQRWADAIVAATVALAANLGMTTVAEGVESASQLQTCREHGVDMAQGFYLARPMSKADFKRWWADGST